MRFWLWKYDFVKNTVLTKDFSLWQIIPGQRCGICREGDPIQHLLAQIQLKLFRLNNCASY